MIVTAGLLYLGLFALAASMDRHRRVISGPWQQPAVTPLLAPAGWCLLALSLFSIAPLWQGGVGLVSWCGLLPLIGGIIMLGLTYRPAWLQPGLVVACLFILAGIVLRV
ncbi:DUF3325 domain-containing protein [Sphingobium lactosutens]|uniref:DUF3325 domain-containing protein n=1 Tax=Sphingobium lactosutens TaxID=522773 RepID=UPI0015BFF97E|nr:DUF3325 domain-containing protein [Sphingobium lactosutens]NWK97658.1 DUF3325 domain-containing protein [Sphingobium lactosutens]